MAPFLSPSPVRPLNGEPTSPGWGSWLHPAGRSHPMPPDSSAVVWGCPGGCAAVTVTALSNVGMALPPVHMQPRHWVQTHVLGDETCSSKTGDSVSCLEMPALKIRQVSEGGAGGGRSLSFPLFPCLVCY